MFRIISIITLIIFASACTTYDYPGNATLGEPMASFTGESLSGDEYQLPKDVSGDMAILLFGFVQNSQFDIDRWLIGLDMRSVSLNIYEIPTIKGFFPRMFANKIDEGMKKGIPQELWSIVITVYDDGDKVQQFLGNQNPNNARVVLIDEQGKIVYFYDRGFSTIALNEIIDKIESKDL